MSQIVSLWYNTLGIYTVITDKHIDILKSLLCVKTKVVGMLRNSNRVWNAWRFLGIALVTFRYLVCVCQVYSRVTKKQLRRRQERLRGSQGVTGIVKKSQSFWTLSRIVTNFSVHPDGLGIGKKCQEVTRKIVQEVNKEPSSGSIKTSSFACFLFKFVKVGHGP